MERTEPSVIKDQGLYASYCGYCKSEARTSFAYGLWALSLSLHDYQDLLNRGWRRSGMFLYRPEMEKTCCPAYSIRLKADSFHKSKEQNRVMRRMERYLDGSYNGPTKGDMDTVNKLVPDALMSNERRGTNDTKMENIETCGLKSEPQKKENHVETDDIARDIALTVETTIKSWLLSFEGRTDLQIPNVNVQKVQPSLRKRIKILKGEPCYTSNIAFLCAAAISKSKNSCDNQQSAKRHEVQRDGEDEVDIESVNTANPVVVAELIASKLQDHGRLHNFKVEACRGHLNFSSMNCDASDSKKTTKSDPSSSMFVEADSRYQGNLDTKDLTSVSTVNSCHGHPQLRHRLEIRMRRSAFDPEEFALYKRYQVEVHHDKPEDVKESSYKSFLVDTPLIFVPPAEEGTSFCGFGSFHQQYLIDGHLVAVGVVDILPSCLSSKYLFWDPDLAFLSLGKYSALQEIQWVQQANKYCPSMEYYYLGYYIHSCPKMTYKAAYRPSELLCPVRFLWVPIDIVRPLLDEEPFVCLSDHLNVKTMQRSTKNSLRTKLMPSGFMDDNESHDEQLDMDLDEVQNQRLRAAAPNAEIASSSKESEDISNVLLKLGNRYLQFKYLQAWRAVPRKHMDALVCDLRKYSQVVGLNLASRMAYALG